MPIPNPDKTPLPIKANSTEPRPELLASPAWTPGRRDFPGLVSLLGTDDKKLHAQVEKSLQRAGASARDWLVRELPTVLPPARARVVRALARLSEIEGGESLLEVFAAYVADEDGRTRRAALTGLGRFSNERVESILLDAWSVNGDAPTRKVIAESLGKAGGDRALALLKVVNSDDPELLRVKDEALLRLSRSRSRGAPSSINADRAPREPLMVRLFCRAGIEDILLEECPREWEARLRGPGLVDATLSGPLSTLFNVRTSVGFGFPVAVAAPSPNALVEDNQGAVELLAAAITSVEASGIISAFTDGAVRYRLDFVSGKHRALVHQLAEAIGATRPDWTNDPSERNWELAIFERSEEGKSRFTAVELRPRLADPRFDWRAADVPAASHPTIAAALARVAGVDGRDIVWDPFVGSGGELIERARLGSYRRLIGGDIDPDALAAARKNLDKSGVHSFELNQANAFDAAPEGVTLVITNPPMGRRVHRQADLRDQLDRFVAHVANALVMGGRMVWISPHGARTAEAAKRVGLSVELRRQVDMGGFPAELQRLRKVGGDGRPPARRR